MKHLLKKAGSLLLTASLAASVLCVGVNAYNGFTDTVTVHAAYGTPVIEGNVADSEWYAPEFTVTLDDPVINAGNGIYQGEWETKRDDPADFTDCFRVMWDENNLYILEHRYDNVVNLYGSSSEAYMTDGVLAFIMAEDIDSDANPDSYVHHIFYTVGDEKGNFGGSLKVRVCNGSERSQEIREVPGSKIASSKTDGGYFVEIAFPWAAIREDIDALNITENKALGFSLVIHDNDTTGENPQYTKQVCWAKFDAFSPAGGYDFGGYGTLILDAKPVVAETPVEEPAADVPAADTPVADAPAAEAAAEVPAATAPTTADAGIVCAAAVMAAAAGIVLSKKEH